MLLAVLIFASNEESAAIFEVRSTHGVAPTLVALLNEELVTHLAKSKTFSSVVGTGDLLALLDLEQQKAALGCDKSTCLAALGGALGVAYLVVPAVGKLGGRYLLNLKIVDVEAALPLWRDRREVTREEDLVGAMKELSQALHIFRHPDALKNRLLPVSLTAVGALVSGLGTLHFFWVKQRYLDAPTRSNYETAQSAQAWDNSLAVGGAVAGLAGAVWWVLQ